MNRLCVIFPLTLLFSISALAMENKESALVPALDNPLEKTLDLGARYTNEVQEAEKINAAQQAVETELTAKQKAFAEQKNAKLSAIDKLKAQLLERKKARVEEEATEIKTKTDAQAEIAKLTARITISDARITEARKAQADIDAKLAEKNAEAAKEEAKSAEAKRSWLYFW